MKPIRIALTKGRLEKTTIELFEKIGYNCDEVKNKGRRLILPVGAVSYTHLTLPTKA